MPDRVVFYRHALPVRPRPPTRREVERYRRKRFRAAVGRASAGARKMAERFAAMGLALREVAELLRVAVETGDA